MSHAVLLVTAFLLPQVMTKVLMCRFPAHSVPGTAAERFSGVPCAHCGWIKLLVETIITGCDCRTQETRALYLFGVKERACIWQVSGSSLYVCFHLFGATGGFSPAWEGPSIRVEAGFAAPLAFGEPQQLGTAELFLGS